MKFTINNFVSIIFIISFFKIVDMTGKETKVLQGYGSLGTQHAKPKEDDDVKVIGINRVLFFLFLTIFAMFI